MDLGDLKDSVALITGGVSGIGLAITKQLLKNKIKNVAILDINSRLAEEVVENLSNEFGKGKIIFIKCNVANEKEMEDAFQKTMDEFNRIDIVINNAGVGHDRLETVNINLSGEIKGCLLGIKHMGKNNGGSGGTVICTSSIHAFDYRMFCPIYNATKSGIMAFVRSYGQQYHFDRNGIRFMVICPGGTLTPLIQSFSQCLMQDYWKELEKIEFANVAWQTPEVLARAYIYVLQNGKNGSTWIADGGSLREVQIPDYTEYSKVVVEDLQ